MLPFYFSEHRQFCVSLREVSKESEASSHCFPLLNGLSEGGVLLDHGVVDHEVLHGGLVYQEVRRTSPSTDLPELLTRSSVSTEGNLVASLSS